MVLAVKNVPSMTQIDSSASNDSGLDFFGPSTAGQENAEPPPSSPSVTDLTDEDLFGGPSESNATSGDTEAAAPEGDQPLVGEESEAPKQESQSEVPTVSIDIRGKQKEFKLDPKDEVLRRTLRNGERAAAIKAEAEKLKVEHKEMSGKLKDYSEAHEVLNEIRALGQEGEYSRIVKAVLGDKFEAFLESTIDEYESFKRASPEERRLMDMERSKKDATYADRIKDREIKRLREQLESESTQKEDGKVHGYATSALTSHKFKEDEIPDADIRHHLNKRTWNNAWDSLKKLSATRELTPDLINKVFEKEFKLMRYGQNKGSTQAKAQVIEEKKEKAATTAAAIATSNYPSQKTQGKDLSKWNGKNAHDLLKLFR